MTATLPTASTSFHRSTIMTRHLPSFIRAAAAGAAIAVVAACSAPGEPIGDDIGVDVSIGSADTLFTGANAYFSGLTDSAVYVVRTPAEWTALWAKATRNQSPAPPAPAVDFSRYMVLVVAMGSRPTTGYTVSIDRVADVDGGRVVEATLTSPVHCVTGQAFTAPFAAVVAPLTALPVHFVNRAAQHRCS
jgi:hypothetical protein